MRRPHSPRTAPKDTPTLPHRLPRFRLAAWSCRRQDRVRFTLRLPWSQRRPRQTAVLLLAAFSAAGRSLTAIGPPAALAAILSAARAVLREPPVSSLAVLVPSIQHAPLPAAMPAPVARARPVLVQALALAPVSAHLGRVAHRAPALQRAKRLPVRHAPRPEDAAVVRSIPRPKKAQ